MKNFLLFVDPYHKSIYQLDLNQKSIVLHGRVLPTAEFPHKFAFNPSDGSIFWFDRYSHVIKSSHLLSKQEVTVHTLSESKFIFRKYVLQCSGLYSESSNNGIKQYNCCEHNIIDAHINAMAVSNGISHNWLFFAEEITKSINYIDLSDKNSMAQKFAEDVNVNEIVVDDKEG